jgi:epoxyqueuosine reductase QueG
MKKTAKELTNAVKEFAMNEGADLVGIAPVSRYKGAPRKLTPQAHMPEAQTVVVMAVHHPDASINFGGEPNSNFSGGFQIGMIPKLDTMALRVARFLEKQGFDSVPLSCTYYWRHRKQRGIEFDHAASFSHMNAFIAAGLGEYGWHGMVMSPEYGPRQRVISVITSAPLTATPIYSGDPLCDRCGQCERACWGKNYEKANLLTPETIGFTIEGKRFEYANVNRWRCFWGEQCHLDMRRLAERPKLDEKAIYKAIDDGVETMGVGGAGYMCASLKFCMSKGVRKWDKSKAANPLRKKAEASADWTTLKEKIISKARAAGADRIAIHPLCDFEELKVNAYEGFRIDDFFNSFKWVISIGRAMPSYMENDENKLAEKNKGPVRSLSFGRLMIGTVDIARFLDDSGYEAMQDGSLFGISRHAATLSGWPVDGTAVQSVICDAPLEALNMEIPLPLEDIDAEEKLSDKANGLLPHIDISGTAKLEDLPQQEREELLQLMPEARSLIVLGVELPKRVVELAGKQEAECAVSYQYVNYQALREAFWAAQDISSALTKKGHKADAFFEIESKSVSQKTPYVVAMPDLRAQAPFASAAGLGFLGKNGFLISPEFGPRQRLGFLLTSADLPAKAVVSGSCPEDCKACAEACPVNALLSEKIDAQENGNNIFKRNETHCEWARVLGMSEGEGTALAGWDLPNLPMPNELDDASREKALKSKDPIQVRCYGKPNNGDTQVERCLQVCPLC